MLFGKNIVHTVQFELVEMTQKQEPWKLAYIRRETMENSDIKKYFQSTY